MLAGLLIAGVIRFAFSDRQPSYQGKPLAYWLCLKDDDHDDAVRDEPHFEEAIRSMGTNCLPCLLKWIAYEPPAWKTKFIDFVVLSGPKWVPERFQEDRVGRIAAGTEDAFRALGHRAAPAIPQLARLVRERGRGCHADRIINALAWIGPEARPVIEDLLDDPRPDIRSLAISGLNLLGANAAPATPRLINCLKDPDENVAESAASTLGFLRLRPELSVPALTNALRDVRVQVAASAERALSMFGYAVPAKKPAPVGLPGVSGQRTFVEQYGSGPGSRVVPPMPTNATPVRR